MVNTSSSSSSCLLVSGWAICFLCCLRSERIVIVDVVFSPVDLDCFLFPLFSLFVLDMVPVEVEFFCLSLPYLSKALESETDDVLIVSMAKDSARFLLPVFLKSSGLKNSMDATSRAFAILVWYCFNPVFILYSKNYCTYLLVLGSCCGIPNEVSLLMGFLLEETLNPPESELCLRAEEIFKPPRATSKELILILILTKITPNARRIHSWNVNMSKSNYKWTLRTKFLSNDLEGLSERRFSNNSAGWCLEICWYPYHLRIFTCS